MIITIYLFLVYLLLPQYMKERNSYSLKTVIFYYNIFQILSCTIIVYQIATPLSDPSYAWSCEPLDYSITPRSTRMLNLCYYVYLLKISELVETVFFVLRKKYNQVSKLHVYHHVSTLMTAWFYSKYFGGCRGMTTFAMMTNSFIHVLMYSYYLIASLGPHWQKRVQFCILIGHALQALNPKCGIPNVLLFFYVPNVAMIFHMFWSFYKNSYMQRNEKKIA
ncbi:ELO domain containing protein, partial [Asbolus verrucosus]